jgi:hypothetical protein
MQPVFADGDDHLAPVAAIEGVKQRLDGLWGHLHVSSSPRWRAVGSVTMIVA